MAKSDMVTVEKGGRAAVAFGSNCVRLSVGEWIVVVAVSSVILSLAPVLWQRFEKFSPGADYRLPYELSSDYRLYERYCRWACRRYETLVVGDSVIWGHYVSRDNTLSHYLNDNAGSRRFANLGVDGIHPAALEGLLRYYGKDISNKNVILHLNPLWMSSRKHDLQIEKEHHFNHPKLVAQFTPRIPCYKASYSERISAVVRRYIPLLSWTSHLNITYFEGMDVPAWTLRHPYRNPLKAVTFRPGTVDHERTDDTARPAKVAGVTGFQWVEPETSLQWAALRRSIRLLSKRGNRVFVLVGPFNEYMLDAESMEKYWAMKNEIEAWLRQNNVDYYLPPALPAEFYRDASHPLSRGYAALAEQLFADDSFRRCILGSDRDSASLSE